MANSLQKYFPTLGHRMASEMNVGLERSLRMELSTANNCRHSTLRRKSARDNKKGKSCGYDEKDIRMFGEFAAPGLAIIRKNCIEKENFPGQWKVSWVTAIFNKGEGQIGKRESSTHILFKYI